MIQFLNNKQGDGDQGDINSLLSIGKICVVLKQKASMQEMNPKAQARHLENGKQPYEQMRLNIPNQKNFILFFFSMFIY